MGTKTVRNLAARRDTPGLASDLGDLVHVLVKGLFDPYRPELHYMCGPGLKWRAKYERAPQLAPDVVALTPAQVDHASMYAPAQRAIRRHNPALTLRIAIFAGTVGGPVPVPR